MLSHYQSPVNCSSREFGGNYAQSELPLLLSFPGLQCTYLLTYSMVQCPSWEANWFAASQEIPRISRNPKVHYRTHKRPPPVSIQGQPNPVHIPTSHLLEIRPNIIHPSTSRSPQWSPSLRFPTKILYTPSPHPCSNLPYRLEGLPSQRQENDWIFKIAYFFENYIGTDDWLAM